MDIHYPELRVRQVIKGENMAGAHHLKIRRQILAGVAPLVVASSHNVKVAGSVTGQGTHLDCEFNTPFLIECIHETTNCFSLASMFLSLPFFLKAIKKCS